MFEHIFRIMIAKISILTLNRINATEPITLINYSTHSRGRYEAITDTYLELYFDDENLVFSTSPENISANDKTMLANQLAKIRINKSNAKLLGQRTGIEFKTVLESTLTKLVDGTKED